MNTKLLSRGKREKNVMVYRKGQSFSDLASRGLRYRGVALIWSAMLLMLMILLVGLGIDWGKLAVNVHQMQNAADAAALAGAQVVKVHAHDATRQRTHDIGFANAAERLAVTLRMTAQPEPFPNPTDWDDPAQVAAYEAAMAPLDIVLGRWVRYNRKFVPTLDAANAVMAITRRKAALGATAPALALIFGPIAGVDVADAERVAVAWAYDSGGAGLICLSKTAVPGLQIGGNANLDVDGGGIHVNATAIDQNNKDGTWIQGGGGANNNAALDAGFINVVGGITPEPNDSAWLSIFEGGDEGVGGFSVMNYEDGVQHIPDPLAAQMLEQGDPYVDSLTGDHLDLPALINNGTFPTFNIPTVDSDATLAPGYYPNGIRLGNNNDVTLVPTSTSGLGTIFIFGGGTGVPGSLGTGLTMTAGSLIGHGVTCYVTQNFSTGVCGVVKITGGYLDLESPGDWQNQQAEQAGGESDLSLVQGLNGIAIWQDPTMVDSKGDTPEAHLNGNGNFFISGTLYFPDPIHMRLEGNLGEAGNQILCGSAKVEGRATITVNYDRRNEPGLFSRCCLVR